MRMTTQERVALAAMADLAAHQGGAPVSLRAIGARQSVSVASLETLFAKLRRSRLVHGARGQHGGYVLARNAALITAADIIHAVDAPNAARRSGRGPGELDCVVDDLCSDLNAFLLRHLADLSLARLAGCVGAAVQTPEAHPPADNPRASAPPTLPVTVEELQRHMRWPGAHA